MPDYKTKSILLVHGGIDAKAFDKLKLKKTDQVFICEGRPSLDAARSNARILLAKGFTPTVICDNMIGFLFARNLVKEVCLACQYADQGGALGDTGALICAVLAKRHKVPVRLVQGIIKTRFLGDPADILSFQGVHIAPKGTKAYVPLVEWVPGKYLK